MSIWKRFEKVLASGLDTSKEALDRARAKAQELGEMGVLKYDILQLERSSAKLLTRLGTEVYELLEIKQQTTVSKGSPGLKELIAELADIQARLAAKESALTQYVKKEKSQEMIAQDDEGTPDVDG